MPAQTKTAYFSLDGGLDVSTPALKIPPGRALALVNYEPWYNGGYRRIYGYERFDGRPRPSQQTFTGFKVDTVAGLTVNDTITGDTSGATGTLIGIWDDDGSFGSDVIGLAQVTGTFVDGETCNSGAFTVGSSPVLRYAPDANTEDAWLLVAQDLYRADIQVVPGSNAVRGAWRRGSNSYAIRDNVGATAGVLHLASASGWTTSGVTMAEYIYFDAGGGGTSAALPVEGDTVTGATSGATATVHRVIEHGGAVGTNDAYGYLVLTGVSGGPFQNNEKLQVGGTDRADADGANVAFAFSAGGQYRFLNKNFFGNSSTYRTYGVNGVDPAFEIDENNIVSPILLPKSPITGQPATNDPFLIEEHRNYLFFAYPGGTFIHTVIGEPLVVNGFLGAAEFGIGDEITGMNSVVGGVLVITSERETRGLFGKDTSDWELRLVGETTGGKLFTAEKLDTVYTFDDLGITSTTRVQQFGDFIGSTVSQLIQPILNLYRDKATCATVVRASNQYRLFFNDGTGLIMYIAAAGASEAAAGQGLVSFGQLTYPIVVRTAYSTEDETGLERTFFVSDDGYVYEDRAGHNFDGAAIRSYSRLVYNQINSPSYRKRFRRAVLELESQKPLALKVIHDLSYGATDGKSGTFDISLAAGGGLWDVDNWDEFFWDGQTVSTAVAQLSGSGTNISLLIYNESATARPFILQGITLHYDLRRLQR